MTSPKKRVGILISGRGSNMQALVAAARARDYPAEIVVVVSSESDAAGLAWAKAEGIPTLGLNHRHYESRPHFESQLQGVLDACKVDLVACAGFMRLMTPDFVSAWRDRMLNIHPSLLPAFKGLHTHERALAAGVRVAGCTVHLVRPEMDDGPILGQAAVAVEDGDTAETLAARILQAEHRLYPFVLGEFAAGKINIENERVVWAGSINHSAALFSPSPLANN